ncbi:hypothetical protein R1flu_020258 [Riccia fluitans]|uniref:Nucleotide-diphospho-sugar transferase domain-containing protein n=1 Tax=Riccia fluitans TaxID=41844 RepID=A0ABD1ZMG5_9MARC
MKPLKVGVRFSLVIVLLLVSYYLGRPLYWEIQSRMPELRLPSPYFSSPASVPNSHPSGTLEASQDSREEKKQEEVKASDQAFNVSTQDLDSGARAAASNKEVKNETLGQVSEQNNTGLLESSLHEALMRPVWEIPTAGSELPPRKAFALRKEIVEFRAKKNVIVVTFANHAFMGFVLSWVKSLTDKGVTNILVGAMDTELLEDLYWRGVPVFDMGSNMKTFDVGWGTLAFHKMGREKVILVNAFLSLGYELLMCDTDMVWIKDPLPYLERYPAADVLTSSDAVVNTRTDDELEDWPRSPSAYNIGIVHWRPTEEAKRMAAEWKALLLSDDLIWDQNGFNDLLKKRLGPTVEADPRLFYAYNGELKLGILPVSIFCSGHTFFIQRLYEQLKLEPYAVHTTFQYGGTEGKRHRLREAKLFWDEPGYYDEPGGYLSYKPSLPESLMTGGEHSVKTHFALVNHQLIQVRNALAVAAALNRTLVMPELWCRFDRMWFGHPGVLEGTLTPQPFLCPMDHIFEVNMMLKDLNYEEFGEAIRFREYSFLDNPHLPSKVKESNLTVELCENGTPGCGGEKNNVSIPGSIRLPGNATDTELKEAFAPYKDAKLIELSSILGVFSGFSDKTTEERFRRRVKTYTGIWCCVQDKDPGHICKEIPLSLSNMDLRVIGDAKAMNIATINKIRQKISHEFTRSPY